MRVRWLCRRKFRWLPEAHVTSVQQERPDGGYDLVQERLVLWLWWGVAVYRR